jgi:PAS domain S-box-containing protein
MRKINWMLTQVPAGGIFIIALLFVGALGAIDYATADQMSFTLFHVLVVLLTAWRAGRVSGMFIALASSVMITAAEWFWHSHRPELWVAIWNLGIRAGVFGIVAALVARLKEFNDILEKRVEQRTAELKAQTEIFRSVCHSIGEGILVANEQGKFVLFTPQAERILGIGATETSSPEWPKTYGLFLPDKKTLFPHEQLPLVRALRGESSDHVELFIRNAKNPDGLFTNITGRPLRTETGEHKGGVVVFRDITARKLAEQRLQAQHTATKILSEAQTLADAAAKILQVICEALEWEVGFLWNFEPETKQFQCVHTWHHASANVAEFESQNAKTTYAHDFGLFGVVYSNRKPVWIPDLTKEPSFKRAQLAGKSNLRAAFAFPVLFEQEILGVFEFYTQAVREPDEDLIQLFATVGSQVGQFIVRKRLEKGILEISDREQGRIGQDLHDGLCQQLVSAAFVGNALEKKLRTKTASESDEASKLCALVDNAITQARNIARGLFPVKLEANGLISALQELAYNISSNFSIRCDFECSEPILIEDNAIATHLYRIAQEATNNALKHAKARQILIELSRSADKICLKIEDDGIGLMEDGGTNHGIGLQIMNYRAQVIGGTLATQRGANGGTVIFCSFPQKGH